MGIPVNVIPQGFNQATPAMLATVAQAMGRRGTGGTRRRRKATSTRRGAARTRRATAARKRKPARLVKGSRAAKAYMAKVRRKRRK